jgi:hypothetical protein
VSAIGQGGGAPAPGAAAPAPGTGQPAPQQQTQGGQPDANDPWGFSQHVANAPEEIRPSLQAILDGLAPSLQERIAPYENLESRMERIAPLLEEPDENGNTTLDGLITLFDLFNDPEREGEFEEWWASVGQEFGFLDEEGEPVGGQGDGTAAPGELDLSGLDPAAQQIVQALQQTVEGLEARLGEFESTNETTQREQAVQQAADQIRTELTTLMQQHSIDGAGDLQSPAAQDILRIAGSYGSDPKAVEKATADYLRITGGAQSSHLQQNGQQLSGVDALRNALAGGGNAPGLRAPGPALGAGGQSGEPEPVRGFEDAKQLAMQRYMAAHGGGQ